MCVRVYVCLSGQQNFELSVFDLDMARWFTLTLATIGLKVKLNVIRSQWRKVRKKWSVRPRVRTVEVLRMSVTLLENNRNFRFQNLYSEISAHFGIDSVKNLVANCWNRFINRYDETDNCLCQLLRWLVRLSWCILLLRLFNFCLLYLFIYFVSGYHIRRWNKAVYKICERLWRAYCCILGANKMMIGLMVLILETR